jgi:hypothetical protein
LFHVIIVKTEKIETIYIEGVKLLYWHRKLRKYCSSIPCISLSPTALQPGVGLGLLQEFPPSLPV